ncbi:unnamed protein product [Clonostachys rhizophaga]|uniref:N-acetyltransferase domain-containing protein n=1 Tax=Clonostachys rhizophaga TaxID=160324 RepID=A0A9N9VGC5_9HYPO|nr:unnamed protein product [Clonostachys rhizophaga]
MATQLQPRDAKLEDLQGILKTDLSAFDGNPEREKNIAKNGLPATKERLLGKYAKFINNTERFKTIVVEINGEVASIGVLDFKPFEDDRGLSDDASDVQSNGYNAYNDVFHTYFARYAGRLVMLRTLATHQDSQRQGCGKAILASLKKEAIKDEDEEKKVIAVYSSTIAEAFYTREGFKLEGTRGKADNPALGYVFGGY